MDALVSVEDVVSASKGSVSAFDPRVQPLIDGATAAIRRMCGWHVAPVITDERWLDGPGGELLRLPTLRLVEVLSVENDGTALDVSTLEWSELGLVRGWWSRRFRGVHVEFRHGFESVPDLAALITGVVLRGLSSPMGATREQAGQLSASWATVEAGISGGLMLSDKEAATVAMYRLEA